MLKLGTECSHCRQVHRTLGRKRAWDWYRLQSVRAALEAHPQRWKKKKLEQYDTLGKAEGQEQENYNN